MLDQAEQVAAGAAGGFATATVEAAAGIWARALALARVEPRGRRTAALTASTLALIGRSLCRRGEVVYDLRVEGGRLRMVPASSACVVTGSADRGAWVYVCTLDGPANTQTVYRRREAVAHVQYLADPARPWLGRAPWSAAALSGRLLAGVERQLSGEAAGASGYVLPVPDVGDRGQEGADADEEEDPLTSLRRDLAAAGGKTTLAPATGAGYGTGPARRRRRSTRRSGSA